MISIPLSPNQYQKAMNALLQAQPPDVDKFILPTANTPGEIDNHLANLSFTYNGSNELDVTPLELKGLVRYASEKTVRGHLIDFLNKLEA